MILLVPSHAPYVYQRLFIFILSHYWGMHAKQSIIWSISVCVLLQSQFFTLVIIYWKPYMTSNCFRKKSLKWHRNTTEFKNNTKASRQDIQPAVSTDIYSVSDKFEVNEVYFCQTSLITTHSNMTVIKQ